ncbi:MAG: lactate racemase domain-containing protein [Halobacteriales archaeon]
MDFPDADRIDELLDPVAFPRLARVSYEPPAEELDDVAAIARQEVAALPLDRVPEGGRIAVGLGSRGITDIVEIATAVIDELVDRGYDPVAVPAMGSHGGATAEGQRQTLGALGLTEAQLGCPIDARMDTTVVGQTAAGDPVHVADAAREADATVVINRVKPHTNFTGRIESGLCKMTAIGLGKRPGASAVHERAILDGYVPAITATLEVIRSTLNWLGGIAIVENFYDRTGHIEGIPAPELPDRESALIERAREAMPTLPYDTLDVLVIDRIGKDVSGTGMDTNVIGRYRVINADDPATPDIKRIVVRGLTEATHGNGHGIGLADLTTTGVLEQLDLDQMYANGLTSGSFEKGRLPMALPTDEQALTAACSAIGPYDPETVRLAWIQDTGHLSSFRVSPALVESPPDHVTIEGWDRLGFEDGRPVFSPTDP